MLTFVLAGILIVCCSSLEAQYFIDNNHTCFVSGLPPSTPAGTDFCTDFASLSCCLPGFDVNTVQEAFFGLIPQGPGCGSSKHSVRAAYSALRSFSCLPCDPREPEYRFRSQIGDIVNGGVVPASPTAADDEFTWRICKTFLYGRERGTLKRGLWGRNASHFTTCGLMLPQCKSSRVYNTTSETFIDLDPACKSEDVDLLIPTLAFGGFDDPAVEMLSYVPQSIGGFQFVVVDDEDPSFSFSSTPCFGSDSAASSKIVSMGAVLLVVIINIFFL